MGVNRNIYISAFLFLHTLTFTQGNDEDCQNMVQELMSSQLGNIVPCIIELGLETPKARAENYNCIMRCMLIKAGTLKPSGEISVIQTVQFGLEKIPLEYLEKALGEISKCVEFAGINFGDPDDVGCLKLRPLVHCGVDFAFNICKP